MRSTDEEGAKATRGPLWSQESVTWPLWECAPLLERRLTPGRAPLGRGMQGSASEPATPPGRAPREGGTVPPRARRRVAQSLSHKVEGSERAPPACWPSGSGAGATPQRVELRSIGVTGAGCQTGEERERSLEGSPRDWGRGSGLSVDPPGAPKSGAAATPVPQSLPGTPGRTFPSSPRLLSSEEPGAGGAGGGAAAEGTASCLKSF